jgi:hypothetical protein
MKKYLLALLLMFTAVCAGAQMIAYTQDGKRIILFPNGSWYYADSLYSPNAVNLYSNQNEQSATNMFQEAYDYAMEAIYGDEFFRSDRENKAAAWAADYLKSNININIGYRTLGQWFDQLYNIAHNYVYKNVFFASERKQNAINWAKNLIEQKATYDWFTNTSRIARYRTAYQVAYDKIFATEFFAGDRKKKASEWANNFLRNRR